VSKETWESVEVEEIQESVSERESPVPVLQTMALVPTEGAGRG